MNKKVILMILDGWGNSPDPKVSAIDNADTNFIDSLYKKYPFSNLRTDGLHVGLPDGQMGNSEVGHMNLGAGRIVYQDLAKINISIEQNKFKKEKVIAETFEFAKKYNKKIHFLGLISDGGVHSHINHLKALIDIAKDYNIESYIHGFTDGRDVDPKSGTRYISDLNDYIKNSPVQIASVTGRYFAMDRDNRWERVKLAYDALVNAKGEKSSNLISSIENNYTNGCTDEFIKPIIKVDSNNQPLSRVKNDDVVIFFNFRTDRGRELTKVLSQKDNLEFDMKKLNLHFVTMTNYDNTFSNIKVIFNKSNLNNTLGEILEKSNKNQLRISETEKYPHVTFFFSGGRENIFRGESRILKNSPKVATYDLKPEMSAYEITDSLVKEINLETHDFICLNFANGDMVGHTGSMKAAIKACEAVDKCVETVINSANKNNYTTILIADHGNCETMINPDGTPNTAHTTNPVPVILIDKDLKNIKSGILGDIAPTILKLMGIKKPKEMTQESLI
ncbi:MAG: 2,3-bisphosphoglycerate-independent phosphoglycerate mutase [Flavobacteriaceae bacterium TMED238]|nr:phosphoglycerate mutase (2,3-diphosphoglycerate-independent) [Flavobacteriaceae bacterium]RPG61369.1 MAG: 2,3-bisphosphoglycerate-independent phosphoglycerate mutase [Flavobacteriaceae bacterium TMED238]